VSDQYEDVCYQAPFLRQVVLRLDFLEALAPLAASPPESVRGRLRSDFPLLAVKEATQKQVQLTLGTDGQPLQRVEREGTTIYEWVFQNERRSSSVTFTASHVAIVYSQYRSFEELVRHLIALLDALDTLSSDFSSKRIGLRYINNIEIHGPDPLDWSDYIHPDLLRAVSFCEQKESVSRAFGIIEQHLGTAYVRFQYGIANPDHPAPVRRRAFVLDFDAYSDVSIQRGKVEGTVKRLHSVIQHLFERSILDQLRSMMHAQST